MTETGAPAGDFTAENEPFALFANWLKDAEASEINDPNALALATVDEAGLPNVRMVLLKGFDTDGFVFYTNFESRKGREILAAGKAAMGSKCAKASATVKPEFSMPISKDTARDFSSGMPKDRAEP